MIMLIVISILICLLSTSTVYGCGPLFPGQERILRFTVRDIMLALPMVYVENPTSRSAYPSVQENAMQAQAFVQNLVTRTMSDVLEQQGRNAGLSYEITSLILSQLAVNVTYEPFKCYSVSTVAQDNLRMDDMDNCLVASDVVTSICRKMAMNDCTNMPPNIKDIPPEHSTVSGTLRIGNIIMAGWSDQMWGTILSRVLQNLSSGPFRANFQGASVNIA